MNAREARKKRRIHELYQAPHGKNNKRLYIEEAELNE